MLDWRRYLPTVKERGAYTGPFSTFAEYHALGVGLALGPAYADVATAYGVAGGAGKANRSGHLGDAFREMAYVGAGVGLRLLLVVAAGVVA